MLPAAKTPSPVLITLPFSDCREILWATSSPLRTTILPLLVMSPLPRNTTSPFVASSVPSFVTAPSSASRLIPRFSAPSPATAVMLPLFSTPFWPSRVTLPSVAVTVAVFVIPPSFAVTVTLLPVMAFPFVKSPWPAVMVTTSPVTVPLLVNDCPDSNTTL